MDTNSLPAGAVVVGVDGSDHSDRAVAWAAHEAHLTGRPLVLAHGTGILLDVDPYAGTVIHELQVAGRELVEATRTRLVTLHPDLSVHTALRTANPRQALLDLAEHAALLVVGSRGHGPVRSVLLGSVSVGLAREAACPVVVVRPHHPGLVRRGVLVGDDGTADSAPVLEQAFRFASSHRLPLTVLHSVWDSIAGSTRPHALPKSDPAGEDARLRLAESLAGFAERYSDVHVEQVISRGQPAASLLAEAEHLDLVVVGRHDRSRIGNLLLGSVAANVVEHAACPVAVVPVAPILAGTNVPRYR
ncbi:universal stress protein [Nocardioides sp. cx-173]|uniref:universal stress protein n=1 Tax=Nocardioides sp. cx-173 TaxID=2898796 RepID=UPI001E298A49|nr:universal stress protein [Nocardioides sp. cx-173]MCD4526787.1 universal stress protein [Nocardioides sp. cx-173]UGB43893.1 universal stress protein [Nocardioides sp. cx-173]